MEVWWSSIGIVKDLSKASKIFAPFTSVSSITFSIPSTTRSTRRRRRMEMTTATVSLG